MMYPGDMEDTLDIASSRPYHLSSRILQIVPAAGVVAVYKNGRWPLVCWAVVEDDDEEDGTTTHDVVGMVIIEGSAELDFVGRRSIEGGSAGFVGYEYE